MLEVWYYQMGKNMSNLLRFRLIYVFIFIFKDVTKLSVATYQKVVIISFERSTQTEVRKRKK